MQTERGGGGTRSFQNRKYRKTNARLFLLRYQQQDLVFPKSPASRYNGNKVEHLTDQILRLLDAQVAKAATSPCTHGSMVERHIDTVEIASSILAVCIRGSSAK